MNTKVFSPTEIVELAKTYRYRVGCEHDFQAGLELVLGSNGIQCHREHDLGRDCGRIDFYLPELKIGIELKVKGSPSEVTRQLYRYAQSPQISALILITARARLASAPTVLNGKPLLTAFLWEGPFH